jgi:hypothetical protein
MGHSVYIILKEQGFPYLVDSIYLAKYGHEHPVPPPLVVLTANYEKNPFPRSSNRVQIAA